MGTAFNKFFDLMEANRKGSSLEELFRRTKRLGLTASFDAGAFLTHTTNSGSNSTILSNPLSWQKGQGINLKYEGDSPDIGVTEHGIISTGKY